MTAFLTLPEVAGKLRVEPLWLTRWLRRHPRDSQGEPFFRRAGRTKLFTEKTADAISCVIHGRPINPPEPPKPAKITRKGFIYFAEGGEFIKIGFTLQIDERMHALRVACPFDLRLLHSEFGTRDIEQRLHRRFKKSHVRGEWFRNCERIVTYIERRKRFRVDIDQGVP